MSILIRELSKLEEYQGCVDIQLEVWQFAPIEVVPAAHLVALHQYGGICLGAFDEASEGRMVGFAVGFAGWNGRYRFHHSHMLAVRPAYRGLRLGEDMKWKQRELALANGFDLMNWTFDPLQAPNANLNINRLGAVVGRYKDNVYGESGSPLHGGIPHRSVRSRMAVVVGAVHANASPPDGRIRSSSRILAMAPRWSSTFPLETTGALSCGDHRLDLAARNLLVEIPPNITDIMARDQDLAMRWRLVTREVFHHYFDSGYWVVALHRPEGRAIYELQRDYGEYVGID